jgi:FkbM family methyltransferase
MINAKALIKPILQGLFGLQAYLVAHSIFVILSMKLRPQEGEVLEFLKLLKPDDTVLDIGANVGAMSVLFARACPQGVVLAFEPIPSNYRALRRVLELFRLANVRTYQCAIGAKKETLQMVVPRRAGAIMEGLSHVVTNKHVSEGDRFEVRSIALDGFFTPSHFAQRVNAIKIDVENFEVPVIEGALALIERDRPIIYCEIWDADHRQAIWDRLQPLGYSIHVAVDKRLKPYDASIHRQINLFFLPTADIVAGVA